MWSCVLIYNILFKERGTHWCWKHLIIPNRVGRAFPDTALDSLPYLDPARARSVGICSQFCQVISVTAQNIQSVKISLGPSPWAIWLRDCLSKKISHVSLDSPQGKFCQIPTSTLCKIYQWRGRTQKAHCCVSPGHEGITSHCQDLPAPSQCSPQFKPRTQCSASFHSELQLFFRLPLPTWLLVPKAPCPWSLSYHNCKSKTIANSYRSSGCEGTRFERCMVTSLLLLQEKIPAFHTHQKPNAMLQYN